MLLKPNTDVTTGTIVGPDGTPLIKPTVILSAEDAALLRQYKKFLHRYALRSATYCNHCFEGNLNDGMRAFVRDDQILLECRHRQIFYGAST